MGILSFSNTVDCPFFDRHFTSLSQMVVDINTFAPKPSNDLKIILSPSAEGINFKETETGKETFIFWKFNSANKNIQIKHSFLLTAKEISGYLVKQCFHGQL